MSTKKTLTFSDFRRELPKKVADCGINEKVQIAISIDGLTAKALYSSIGDVSKYVEHCIKETVWREGGMLTVDGIVSAEQLTITNKKLSKDGKGDNSAPEQAKD